MNTNRLLIDTYWTFINFIVDRKKSTTTRHKWTKQSRTDLTGHKSPVSPVLYSRLDFGLLFFLSVYDSKWKENRKLTDWVVDDD